MGDTTIRAINHFETEVGELTADQSEQVGTALLWFMHELRKIIDPTAPAGQACMEAGPRCLTCAFNPRTDVLKGFMPTAYGVLKSVRDGLSFYCHRNQDGWKDRDIDTAILERCEGFEEAMVLNPQKVIDCAARTLAALEIIAPKAKLERKH